MSPQRPGAIFPHTKGNQLVLLVRVHTQLCALSLEHVEETMRPLPVQPVAGVPSFVRGVAMIRGVAVPVVDASSVLGYGASHAARFVTMRTGRGHVALAVDEVVGIREIPPASLQDLPPLLTQADSHIVSAIGTLDAELLMVLQSARLVPDEAWAAINAVEAQT